MNILISLTYYRPHISGLTVYNQRLAEGLAARGHRVTVLTSRYSKELPRSEVTNGVEVVRVPVRFRIGKGVVAPSLPRAAWAAVRENDVVLLNLPNTPLESFFIPLFSRFFRRRLVSVFHCDVRLPGGIWNRVVESAVRASSAFALLLSDAWIGYTNDYIDSIGFLQRFRRKAVTIPPPIAARSPKTEETSRFRSLHGLDGRPSIGFAGRLASEKGIEDLLRAFPLVRAVVPDVQLLFAGERESVIGEREYLRGLEPLFRELEGSYRFLGLLEPERIDPFYAACAVIVLPSRNRTESFGLVQAESMLNGVPVVAADLPGVRVPVRKTGMGVLVKPGDVAEIAEAIVEVLSNRNRYLRPRAEVEAAFSLEETLDSIERLLAFRQPE